MKIQKKKPLTEKQLAECAALKEIFNAKKEALGLTQEKAAQHLGMNQGSFSHYLNGRNAINLEFALSVSQLLGVPVTDFAPRYATALSDFGPRSLDSFMRFRIEGKGAEGHINEWFGHIHASAAAYPLVPWYSLRMRNPASDRFEDESDPDFIASTEPAGADGYWIPMQGPSMSSAAAPSFPPGSYLLIKPNDFEIKAGKFYLARHSGGDFAIRQYMREASSDYLVALNPTFPTLGLNPDWTLVGRVVDVRMPGL
ncbi:XRE family transcriptional regulator [Pseudomonas asgharzadehiana]|uniref:XRE family transcriptional regulator n=1 Tax=Pseudomonas asgharzadehiana TaxID=2842349 RepID=A0ABX8P3X9_9PSED|nr:XRE family transcriptional regulator [Pseudomonas asgharzadehiana]QXH68586.1 XRE family transcriptional regulator [Pseudomonas asgharzadehiana]